MMTPREFLRLVIARWEGGYECYADDSGNWITTPSGQRLNLGTMRGVTPAALAAHRGVDPSTLTRGDMESVTLDEAADIGVKHYYQEPGLSLLAWGPATAALLDFAWGAGPRQATLSLQRLVGTVADGAIGPVTAHTYGNWIQRVGWDTATAAVHDMRAAFYRYLAELVPADAQFLQGWLNRDDWASAVNPEWRTAWAELV